MKIAFVFALMLIVGAQTGIGQNAVECGLSETGEATPEAVDGLLLIVSPCAMPGEDASRGRLLLMNADGSNVRLLLPPDPEYFELAPAWSPDGTQIAFTRALAASQFIEGDVYAVKLDGSDLRQLTDGDFDESYPAWSPNGTQITFDAHPASYTHIYVMNADGTNVRQLTETRGLDGLAAWSPDGASIAFTSDRDGDYDLYIMNRNGTDVYRLIELPGFDGFAVWSPDGTQIAFVSESDGDREIFVVGSDGSNLRQLTDNDGRDFSPAWSPDGTQIAFVSVPAAVTSPPFVGQVYVMDADGANLRPVSELPATAVRW